MEITAISGCMKLDGNAGFLRGEAYRIPQSSGPTSATANRTSKKGQKKWYSGKKKCHTIKTLIVIDAESKEVLAIFQGKGSEHDFSIFKRVNKALSHIRIRIEHVNRRLKRFRIFSCRYRNKRKRHGLRMSLLCGVYNFEIS